MASKCLWIVDHVDDGVSFLADFGSAAVCLSGWSVATTR